MKRRNIALSLMASFCISGALSPAATYADNPFEKLIPRGKLLKMLKDEITGETEADEPEAQRPTRARTTKTPTPATQRDKMRDTRPRQPARTAAPSREQAGRDQARRDQARRDNARRDQARTRPVQTRPLPPITSGTKKRSVVSAAQGSGSDFGMTVRSTKNDHLVVTGVKPGGNAAEAGFRLGDRLIAIGGGELTSLEEFQQIAKTLGQGDQVEVGFVRKGKKLSGLLQYGAMPEAGPVESRLGVAETAATSNMQSVLDAPVEHVSRLERIVPTAKGPSVNELNDTIATQRQRMKAMAEELELLRRAHQPAVAPTANNWSFPDLTGPSEK